MRTKHKNRRVSSCNTKKENNMNATTATQKVIISNENHDFSIVTDGIFRWWKSTQNDPSPTSASVVEEDGELFLYWSTQREKLAGTTCVAKQYAKADDYVWRVLIH